MKDQRYEAIRFALARTEAINDEIAMWKTAGVTPQGMIQQLSDRAWKEARASGNPETQREVCELVENINQVIEVTADPPDRGEWSPDFQAGNEVAEDGVWREGLNVPIREGDTSVHKPLRFDPTDPMAVIRELARRSRTSRSVSNLIDADIVRAIRALAGDPPANVDPQPTISVSASPVSKALQDLGGWVPKTAKEVAAVITLSHLEKIGEWIDADIDAVSRSLVSAGARRGHFSAKMREDIREQATLALDRASYPVRSYLDRRRHD